MKPSDPRRTVALHALPRAQAPALAALAALAAFTAFTACTATATPSASVAVRASGLEQVWIEALGME